MNFRFRALKNSSIGPTSLFSKAHSYEEEFELEPNFSKTASNFPLVAPFPDGFLMAIGVAAFDPWGVELAGVGVIAAFGLEAGVGVAVLEAVEITGVKAAGEAPKINSLCL